jgi:hypothetical protein
MKGKKKLLTKFKFFLIPTVEMLQEEIKSQYNLFFLLKLSLQTRFKVFFRKKSL